MRSKKFLSLILVLCMVMQILPVFATETEATETAVTSNIRYIINDNFDDGSLGNWVEGSSTAKTNEITDDPVAVEAEGAVGKALHFKQKANGGYATGTQGIIRNDLDGEKLEFGNGKKIVLKARIRHDVTTDNGYSQVYLNVNRPDDVSALKFFSTNANINNEISQSPYTILRLRPNGVAPVKYTDRNSVTDTLVSESMAKNWVDVEIVFDGTEHTKTVTLETPEGETTAPTKEITSKDGYTVTAKTATSTGTPYSGSLLNSNYTVYEAAKYDPNAEDFAGYTALESISFMFSQAANDLYIDYIQLYEITTVDATAALASNAVKTDGSVDIAFTTDANITEVPAAAATVKDAAGNTVKVTQTYNAATKTISLKPEAALTENAVYKVNLNTEALAESGINVTNAAEMLVVATNSGKSPIKYHIYDTFDDGSVGNWKEDTSQPKTKGNTSLTVDTTGDIKALKYSSTEDVNATLGAQATIRNDFAQKLTFGEASKIVLKTRIKHSASGTSGTWVPSIRLKANRPKSAVIEKLSDYNTENATLFTETQQDLYTILSLAKTKLSIPKATTNSAAGNKDFITAESLADTWVDVEVVFDGADVARTGTVTTKENYTISVKTDDMEEPVEVTSTLWAGNTSNLSKAVYGLAGYPVDAENFAGFPALESLTFMLQYGANDLYIDELQLYEITADQITASVAETAQYDEAIEVTFSGADEIAVPVDAVTLTAEDGTAVEATTAYDATTKVFTITPAKKLTLGNKYKINIDGTKLATETAEYIGEASYTVTAKDRGGLVVDYNFDDESIGDWVLNTGTCEEGTIKLEPDTTTDGSKVMALTKTTAKGFHPHQFGYAYLKLPERVNFEEGKKVVVKAKIMKTLPTDTTSNNVSILANAAKDITNIGHAGTNSYVMARVTDSGIIVPKSGARENPETIITADTNSQWVDLEIVFDGTELTSTISDSDEDETNNVTITHRDGYKVTAKVGETKATSAATSLFHDIGIATYYPGYESITKGQGYQYAYEEAGYTDFTAENFHSFEGLDSISFLLNGNANTVYIDSVQVKVVDTTEVSATVDDRADYNGAIEVVFDNAIADPSAAVTLTDADGNDVAVTKAYNTDTNTLTLKPSANLNVGKVYTVNIDTAKINVPEYEYTGEASFEVLVRGENGLIYSDSFENGYEGWTMAPWTYPGNSAYYDGYWTFGTDDNGAMKFSVTKGGNNHSGGRANIYYNFAKPLTFEEGKKIIIKTKIKHTDAGGTGNKVFFKANRPIDGAVGENSNNITEMSKGLWTMLTLESTKVAGRAYGDITSGYTLLSKEEDDTYNNEWIEVEIVFDGNEVTRGTGHKTREDYTITVKSESATASNKSSLWHSTGETGTLAYAASNPKYDTTSSDFAGYESLDSLSFVMGTSGADDLYVDYVEVYEVESYDGYAQMPAGNTVKYNKAIELKFTGAHPVLGIPDGVVTVKDAKGTKLEVTQNWDKENNILSITPAEGTFAKGTQYGVTISKNVLATVGMNYVGTTYFTVTARDDYETAEVVIDNQFNKENDTEGWAPGVVWPGQEDKAASVVADGQYLHVTIPKAAYNTGYDGSVTKLLGNGIELTEGKKIVIETKIKNVVDEGLWSLHLNRPEDINNISGKSGDFNTYLLVKDNSKKNEIQVPANRLTNDPNGTEAANYVFAYGIGGTQLNEEEHVADPATIETYNKWVKYTITITDEEIYNLHVKAEILDDSGNVTATYESTDVNKATIKTAFPAYERVFGKIPGYTTRDDYAAKQEEMNNMYKKWFSADRLTFGIGAVTSNPSEFYIDYITVTRSDYEAPIESVASASVPSYFEAGNTVTPTYTLQGNTGTVFNVISAKYVDGKLAGTHFEKVTAENTNEFTHTDATGWTVDASGDVVIKAFVWDNSFVPLCEAATGDNIAKIQVYVDAENGSDMDGTGDKTSPVKSLGKAFTLATAAYNADTAGVNKSTEIILASGTYSVAEGAIYVQNVSYPEGGLTIKAADGATPVIDGGYQFSLADAEQVTDSDILGRLPSGVDTTKIYALNLKTKMSSIPDVTYPGSYKLTNVLAEVAGKDPETFGIPTCEASVDGSLMTVARYPNTGYAYTGAISDLGVEYGTTITTSNYTDGFSFACSDANISRWGKADQALMFGYWGKDWATQTVPMASAENGTITSGHASIYKVLEGQRYYVYNLLEEIDTAGEYFIDRNTESDTYGTMFFYWPEGATKDSTISISSNNSILMSLNSNNITVDGLTFANGRRYGVATDANSSGNIITNCTIKNIAQAAAWIQGSGNEVTNCKIYDVNGGISLFGGDVISLTAANNKATHNTIRNYARLNKTYSDAIHLYNAGNTASYNEIYDGEHLAIRFEGVNHTISYNDIHDVCQEVDDAGAIYAGRTWIDRGNKITNNYIHDIAPNGVEQAEGVAGIFLDDHYAGAYIEGNVFANITGHGVRGNAGREHTIKNNLFVECTKGGVSIKNATGQYTDYTDRMTEVTDFLADIEKAGKTELWNNAETGFPELYSIGDNTPYHAWGHTYLNNVTVKCAEGLTAPSLTPNEIAGSFFGDQVLDYKTSVTGNFDTAYNKELTEGDGYNAVIGGNYGVTADMVGITGFTTIDFANMGK